MIPTVGRHRHILWYPGCCSTVRSVWAHLRFMLSNWAQTIALKASCCSVDWLRSYKQSLGASGRQQAALCQSHCFTPGCRPSVWWSSLLVSPLVNTHTHTQRSWLYHQTRCLPFCWYNSALSYGRKWKCDKKQKWNPSTTNTCQEFWTCWRPVTKMFLDDVQRQLKDHTSVTTRRCLLSASATC